MNLYLLSQGVRISSFAAEAYVVCAEDANEAYEIAAADYPDKHWVPENLKHLVEIELIGIATESTKKGVILSHWIDC